ncbi:isoform A [Brachionus plicatilis]|uniref:Isoform A n=1 Tax=Brachionus plicatilis TaxID=10195 RepID=A0A3M7SAI8_BRAPC|nr:isoform A [Brachionus plicatilis]
MLLYKSMKFQKSHDIYDKKISKVSAINLEVGFLIKNSAILDEDVVLQPIDPVFDNYDSRDFFNLLGPIKVYSSENELSIPYSCILRKLPNNPTFGITVKGDSPVRINNVDPNSYAYFCFINLNVSITFLREKKISKYKNLKKFSFKKKLKKPVVFLVLNMCAGIRQGDFIIAIQDTDVRWSKHGEVVSKIRSQLTSVKLTLLSCKTIPREVPIFCEDNQNNKIKNCCDKTESAVLSPTSCKKILSNNFNSDEPDLIENHIWWNKFESEKKSFAKSERLRQRIFKLPNGMHSTRCKSPFVNLIENNFLTNKICHAAKNGSNNLEEKCSRYKLNNLFRSTNNLCPQKQDQSKDTKENIVFWTNLQSSIKTPLTNTLTLGRKFKKNVLKLSLFNNFNSNEADNINESKNLDENTPHSHKMPPLPSTVKSKKLRRKIKLKELDKTNETDGLLKNKKEKNKKILKN